jgi:hypothetical protein
MVLLKNIPLEQVDALHRRKDPKALALLDAYARAQRAARDIFLTGAHTFEREKARQFARELAREAEKAFREAVFVTADEKGREAH